MTVLVLLLRTPCAFAFTEAEKEAMIQFRPTDGPMVVEWMTLCGITFGVLTLALSILLVVRTRHHARRAAAAGNLPPDLSTPLCLLLTAVVVSGGLAVAAVTSGIVVAQAGIRRAVAEAGLIEGPQLILWMLATVLAMSAARFLPAREARHAMFLLGLGALLAAARELDMHLLINPRRIGDWGMAFRVNWWLSRSTPVLPRLLWGAAGIVVIGMGLYAVRRGAPAILGPGRRLRRLLPCLGAVAALFFVSFSMDDLLRFRVRLHPARVIEETVELAAVIVYVACVTWAIQTAWRETDEPPAERAAS